MSLSLPIYIYIYIYIYVCVVAVHACHCHHLITLHLDKGQKNYITSNIFSYRKIKIVTNHNNIVHGDYSALSGHIYMYSIEKLGGPRVKVFYGMSDNRAVNTCSTTPHTKH